VSNDEERRDGYTFEDVVSYVGIAKDDKMQIGKARKRWKAFLVKLNIDEMCFKGRGGRWCFDEYGKDMVVEFLKHGSDENYKSIRRLEAKEGYVTNYQNFIAQALSNLNYNRNKASERKDKKMLKKYPKDREVFTNYWIDIYYYSKENVYILPWMRYMKKYIEMLDKGILRLIIGDFIYAGGEIQSSFDELTKEYYEKMDTLSRGWILRFDEVIKYRINENIEMNKNIKKESIGRYNKIAEECKLFEDYTDVNKLSDEEEHIKEMIKYRKKMERRGVKFFKKLAADEELEITIKTPSAELYDEFIKNN